MSECDVLLLQEHWLLEEQFHSFQSNFSNAHVYAVSGMRSDTLISGRPFGGCAILINANLPVKVHPIELQSRRVCGIRMVTEGHSELLIFCVYMPCDTEFDSHNLDEFNTILAEFQSTCDLHPSEHVIIGGDYNTCFDRSRSLHTPSLIEFMNDNSLCCGLNHSMSDVTYTYESKIDGTRSLVDHFMLTETLYQNILRYHAVDTGENMSDHLALLVELKFDLRRVKSRDPEKPSRGMRWALATENDILLYRATLDFKLLSIDAPREALECQDFQCKHHTDSVFRAFKAVCDACIEASSHLEKRKRRKVPVAGWSERVQGFKDSALLWHRIWKENGSPAAGLLFDLRKSTRKKYHAALKQVRAEEERIQASRMADALLSSGQRNLWTEVRKIRASQKKRLATVVDDHRDEDICSLFSEKYKCLYNSVSYDNDEMESLKRSVDGLIDARCANDNCYSPHSINATDVERAARKLKAGKSDGDQRMYTDHLKKATPTFYHIIACLFNALVVHGIVPSDFETSTLIPIPKGTNKSLSCSDNYRAIAMSSVICKLLDHVLINSHSRVLMSSDLQFGFKANNSAMTCNFVFQEVVQYYVSNDSNVYCLSLDATKAFDRVQFSQLFHLLICRNMCPVTIRFLVHLYTRQRISVQWGDTRSEEHPISNGVKQGGVLSPILFAVYLDELLLRLKSAGYGCHLGSAYAGAVAYADDVCLLAPNISCLRQMLKTTEVFAKEYRVTFNGSKSILLTFGNNEKTLPNLQFMGKVIPSSPSAKHLGVQIGRRANEQNIANSVADLYARTNGLKALFRHVPWRVRLKLFSSFCLHLYGCESWDISSNRVESFSIAYRKCIRHLIDLPYRTHRALIPLLCNAHPIEITVEKRIAKFVFNSAISQNQLVQNCSSSVRLGSGSSLSNSMSKIASKFNIYRFQLTQSCLPLSPPHNDSQENELYVISNAITELLDCLDSVQIVDGFSHADVRNLLSLLCEH